MLIKQEAKDEKHSRARLESLMETFRNKQILTVVVEPCSQCNLSCTFCDMHSGRIEDVEKLKGKMKFETFKRVVGQFRGHTKLKEMQFHGNGEPLLNNEFPEFVRYAKQNQVAERYRLTTNGTILTPKKLKKIVESGIDSIHISLDVADKDRYKKLKKSNLYEKVEKNIEFAIDYLSRDGRCELFIKYAIPHESYRYGFSSKEAESVLDRYRHKTEDSKTIHLKGMPVVALLDGKNNQENPQEMPCEIPFYSLFVRYDGTVTVCCADLFGDLDVGNINEDLFLDILNSERMKRIRSFHLDCNLKKLPLCYYCGNRTVVDISPFVKEMKRINNA